MLTPLAVATSQMVTLNCPAPPFTERLPSRRLVLTTFYPIVQQVVAPREGSTQAAAAIAQRNKFAGERIRRGDKKLVLRRWYSPVRRD